MSWGNNVYDRAHAARTDENFFPRNIAVADALADVSLIAISLCAINMPTLQDCSVEYRAQSAALSLHLSK